MPYNTIIFDMDGVIIDSEHFWSYASKELFKSKGVELTDKLIKEIKPRLIGKTQADAIREYQKVLPVKGDPEVLGNERMAIVKRYYQNAEFVPGFKEFLEKLGKLKLKLGVATGARPEIIELVDNKLNLRQFFGDHIYKMADVGDIGKPDPAIYLYAAKKLNSKPEECIVIEDAANGIMAGKRAGMFTIAITTTFDRDHLIEYKPNLLVDKFNEINLDELLQR